MANICEMINEQGKKNKLNSDALILAFLVSLIFDLFSKILNETM